VNDRPYRSHFRLQQQQHKVKQLIISEENILIPAIFDVCIYDFMVLLISLPFHVLPKREIHRELQTTKLFFIFIPNIFSLLEYEPYAHTLVHFILEQINELSIIIQEGAQYIINSMSEKLHKTHLNFQLSDSAELREKGNISQTFLYLLHMLSCWKVSICPTTMGHAVLEAILSA
jgi:hypothetical protein